MLRLMKCGMMVAGLGLTLSACQMIPGTAPAPAPVPVPAPAPEARLPDEVGRHQERDLVPLSGPNAEVGQALANATAMALLDTNAQNFEITTYDTGTSAGTAAARAISEGNDLILGPLLGGNVPAVLAQARPANIPLITFSNDLTVADRDVFVLGQAPEQSIARTVGYAAEHGARRFAALVPSGEYGRRAEAALAGAVRNRGGELVAIERYDRGNTNTSIVSAARRLRAQGGFDSVLIADRGSLAAAAAKELKGTGESLPRILGTELWNGDARVASSPALRGALFSAISDARYRQFVNSYETRFGDEPFRIATLGYDAVLLALRLAQDWEPGQPFPATEMVDPDGFLGLDGPFRFQPSGIGERAMEVRQVGGGKVTVVDPAPERFGNK